MKKILLPSLFISTIAILILSCLLVYPYYTYNKALKNQVQSQWYALSRYDERFLSPSKKEEIEKIEMKNEELWSLFHFQNIKIPLPRKNPFYRVSPDFGPKSDGFSFGLNIYDTKFNRISRIIFVKPYYFDRKLRSQKLFKLPIVREVLVSLRENKLWKLIFSKEIKGWNHSFSEMMTNLYLIHLRSLILPQNFTNYKLINDTTALIELETKNKDFSTELVLTRARGLIYSFIIVTEKDNQESRLVRSKFLREVEFSVSSKALSSILYKEFKALDFRDQSDNLGMLYLLSAWSHDKKMELIKEIIFYLERGEANQKELEAFYPFAINKYHQSFSTQLVEGINLDPKLLLKVSVDREKYLEENNLKNELVEKSITVKKEVEGKKSIKQRAKRETTKKEKRMFID